MTHTFIVNTENVNEYGYRVLTEGIDSKQFMRNPVVLFLHERYNKEHRGSEVIGRVVKLWIEDKKLMADIEFDTDDDFAKKIADKVERGYIRMASMYADVVAASNAPEDLLPGQVFETVTKCKLIEISIVDIGGNDDALKLSKAQPGDTLKLKKLTQNTPETMSHFKTIALALGQDANIGEEALLKIVQKMKLDKETAESNVITLSKELKGIRTAEATKLTDRAIELGLLPEGLKATQMAAFEADHDGQVVILTKLISEKEGADGQEQTHSAVKEVVLNAKGKQTATDTDETFDYLQKHNVVKLRSMKEKEPEKYNKIHQDYLNGVRHSDK